jgi:hypothetical protein
MRLGIFVTLRQFQEIDQKNSSSLVLHDKKPFFFFFDEIMTMKTFIFICLYIGVTLDEEKVEKKVLHYFTIKEI